MKLHDSPAKTLTEENDEISKLPPAQRKKLRQKQKKAEARAKRVISQALFKWLFFSYLPLFLQEAEEKQEDEAVTSNSSKSGTKQPARPVDLDPRGEKLVQVFICTAWPCTHLLLSVFGIPDIASFILLLLSWYKLEAGALIHAFILCRLKIHWQKPQNT
jgi:hypothetical protein